MLLEALFSSLRADEQILVCTPNTRKLVSTVAEANAFIEHYREHEAVAFGIAPRLAGQQNTVSRITALWLDIDEKDFKDEVALTKALQAFPIPPTFVVHSGHGRHLYWVLRDSALPKQAQDLMRTMGALVGGDLGVHNPSRLFRAPGTTNFKDSKAPVPCVLAEATLQAIYSFDDLAKATQLSAKTTKIIATGLWRKQFKSRSERDWHVIRELVNWGISDEMIYTIFQLTPVGDKYLGEPNPDRWLAHTIENARESSSTGATFVEVNDCYYFMSARGRQQASTFVFEPSRLLKVVDGDEDYLAGTMKALGFEWKGMHFPKSAFSSTSQMLKNLPIASWQWLGTDRQVRQLLPYLMKQLLGVGFPHAHGAMSVGRYENYWVTDGCTFDADKVYELGQAPYVYLKRRSESPILDFEFPDEDTYRSFVTRMALQLPLTNTNSVVAAMAGWFFATPLKPVFESLGIRFPILNVFGTKGSGKSSSILQVYNPLMGWKIPRAYSSRTTLFVLLTLWSSSNAVPVSFGEYRHDVRSSRLQDFIRLILLAYDVGYDARGRPDQSTRAYPLTAPVSVDGEDAFMDPATRERAIIVNLAPDTINERSDAFTAFRRLVQLPLRLFAGKYIQRTLRVDEDSLRDRFEDALAQTRAMLPGILPDRVRRNLAVVVVGLTLYNEHMRHYGAQTLQWDASTFEPLLRDTLIRLGEGRTRILIDDFAEDIINYADRSVTTSSFYYMYDEKRNVLWFHLTGAFGWWAAKRRREGRAMLELPAIRAQLRERIGEGDRSYVKREAIVRRGEQRRRCYGLRLQMCSDCGLDVPDRLQSPDTFMVRIQSRHDQGGE